MAHAQRETDSVVHKPCRFLSDADGLMDFIGTNPVLAIHNLPHRGQPLVQTERRVLKDRTGFQSELRRVMFLAAMPAVVFLQEQNVIASATRTGDTVRPAPRHKILAAIGGI